MKKDQGFSKELVFVLKWKEEKNKKDFSLKELCSLWPLVFEDEQRQELSNLIIDKTRSFEDCLFVLETAKGFGNLARQIFKKAVLMVNSYEQGFTLLNLLKDEVLREETVSRIILLAKSRFFGFPEVFLGQEKLTKKEFANFLSFIYGRVDSFADYFRLIPYVSTDESFLMNMRRVSNSRDFRCLMDSGKIHEFFSFLAEKLKERSREAEYWIERLFAFYLTEKNSLTEELITLNALLLGSKLEDHFLPMIIETANFEDRCRISQKLPAGSPQRSMAWMKTIVMVDSFEKSFYLYRFVSGSEKNWAWNKSKELAKSPANLEALYRNPISPEERSVIWGKIKELV